MRKKNIIVSKVGAKFIKPKVKRSDPVSNNDLKQAEIFLETFEKPKRNFKKKDAEKISEYRAGGLKKYFENEV